jgi:hypothetical protein
MYHKVLFERAAAQVAARTGGAHSVEVWFAVLAAMPELGLDSDNKLSALTHAEVVRVVHFLEARSIPVGPQFVQKVAVGTLAREGGHFGPAAPRRGGEGGLGARTLSENDMAYIVGLLRWNGGNGIGLRVADIRADIARDLGIDVSESTIRAVLARRVRRVRRGPWPTERERRGRQRRWVHRTRVGAGLELVAPGLPGRLGDRVGVVARACFAAALLDASKFLILALSSFTRSRWASSSTLRLASASALLSKALLLRAAVLVIASIFASSLAVVAFWALSSFLRPSFSSWRRLFASSRCASSAACWS